MTEGPGPHGKLGKMFLSVDVTYLSLRQIERLCQLRLPPDGDVPAVVELLLQLQPLVVAVHHAILVLGACATYRTKTKCDCVLRVFFFLSVKRTESAEATPNPPVIKPLAHTCSFSSSPNQKLVLLLSRYTKVGRKSKK